MRILLHSYLDDSVQDLGGTPAELEQQLLQLFPWEAERPGLGGLGDLIESICSSQHYHIDIINAEANPGPVDKLLQHPLRGERLLALKLPGVTVEHLHEALNDSDHGVAEAVLQHELVNGEVLHQALAHPRQEVRILALRHPLCDSTHLEQALQDLDLPVLEAVANHPLLDPEQVLKLLRTPAVPLHVKVVAMQKLAAGDPRRLQAQEMLEAEMQAPTVTAKSESDYGQELGQWFRGLGKNEGDAHAEHLNDRDRLRHGFAQEPREQSRGGDAGNSYVEDMCGYNPLRDEPAFAAAAFLAGADVADADAAKARSLLWEEDGDAEAAALLLFGLERTPENEAALAAALAVGGFGAGPAASAAGDPTTEAEGIFREPLHNDGLHKSEPSHDLLEAKSVEPATADGKDTAAAVRRGLLGTDLLGGHGDAVKPIALKGKHSRGTVLVEDDGKSYLLKPGSGPMAPTAGAKQVAASQSAREALFWHVARAWGLQDNIPRADLLLIDGREVAAIAMLPLSYRNLERRWRENPMATLWTLDRYRRQGILHRWAILDGVLGNADRHGQNMMMDNESIPKVYLIDHGSAFAGPAFDPAHDRLSFIPFYLRCWVGKTFNRLPPELKLRYLPRLPEAEEADLRAWLEQRLHVDELRQLGLDYGVDVEACVERLARLRSLGGPVDLRINRLWVEGGW